MAQIGDLFFFFFDPFTAFFGVFKLASNVSIAPRSIPLIFPLYYFSPRIQYPSRRGFTAGVYHLQAFFSFFDVKKSLLPLRVSFFGCQSSN